jgi:hypothetical protein
MEAHIRDVICCGDEGHFRWVVSWCARILQDPGGDRPGSAIVLRGGQGTGKGMFAVNFGRIVGPHFKHLTQQEQLTRAFNAHLKDAVFVFADEACYPGDKSAVGRLKALITEPTLTIEPKGVDAFQLANHINLVMASNETWTIPAELDSRRFMCLDVSAAHKQDKAYFGALQRQMDAGGLAAWMHALLAWDWSQADLRNPPQTGGLRAQKVHSLGPIESYWNEAIEDTAIPLVDARGDLIGGIGWPVSCAKTEMIEGFWRYCRQRNIRHPPAASAFWKRLRAFGVEDAPRVKGERCVRLPEIDAATLAWEDVLAGKTPVAARDEETPF